MRQWESVWIQHTGILPSALSKIISTNADMTRGPVPSWRRAWRCSALRWLNSSLRTNWIAEIKQKKRISLKYSENYTSIYFISLDCFRASTVSNTEIFHMIGMTRMLHSTTPWKSKSWQVPMNVLISQNTKSVNPQARLSQSKGYTIFLGSNNKKLPIFCYTVMGSLSYVCVSS